MIATMTFVFSTSSHTTGNVEHDHERLLTDIGENRALALRKYLGDQRFEILVSSPAARAFRTAKLVGGEHVVNNDIIQLEELYDRDFCATPRKQQAISDRINEVGKKAAKTLIERIDAYVLRWTREHGVFLKEWNVLVATHKTLVPTIAANVLKRYWDCQDEDQRLTQLQQMDLKEQHAVRIKWDGALAFIRLPVEVQ